MYKYKDDKIKTLGYGSRALAKAERKYHSSKLDFLSLKWAVSEQFWDCLTYTKQIEVSRDNNLLLYVLSAKVNPTGQGGLMNLLFLILIFITNLEEIIL